MHHYCRNTNVAPALSGVREANTKTEKIMRKVSKILAMMALGATFVTLQSCTSMMLSATSSYVGDDMYVTHDRAAIQSRIAREQEAARKAEEARIAQMEALVAAADADAEIDAILGVGSGSNSYDSILADDYESAYERRLRGFSSSTYNMPSSYYNYRTSDAYFYASSYDPAFYNVMVMGDQVWVEPRYITSMFGTWGMPSLALTLSITPYGVGYDSWYWNNVRWRTWYMDPWYRPYYYHFGWNDPWMWYDPWPGYRPHHPPHHHRPSRPAIGGSHRPPRPAISHNAGYGYNRADSPGTRINGRGSTTNRGAGGTGESYRRNDPSSSRGNNSYNRNDRNERNNSIFDGGSRGGGSSFGGSSSSGSSNRGGFSGGSSGSSGGGGVRSGGGTSSSSRTR